MSKDKIIAIIDIGSSKVSCLIAEVNVENIQIIGVSTVLSKGIKKGVVVDIDEAVEVIFEAVKAAERMAGVSVSRVWVTVNGSHISSVNSQGVVAVSSSDGEIHPGDVDRVTEAARATPMPNSREIVHVIPRTFVVDSQEGVVDPVGMSGVRLQVETHIISGAATSMRNLVKSVQQVGLDVENLIFTGLAAAESVVNETEKELGVMLVDIGGGTSSIVIMSEGSPVYSSVLKLGGKNITADIAIGLRVSMEEAGKIKHFISEQKPVAAVSSDRKDKQNKDKKEEGEIDLAGLGLENLRKVEKKFLIDGIINPRLEEIAEEIMQEIKRSGHEGLMPAGLVLCGGTAQTVGIKEILSQYLNMPVRVAEPSGVSGLVDEVSSSAYAASIGAVIYAAGASEPGGSLVGGFKMPTIGVGNIWQKMVEFVKGFMP